MKGREEIPSLARVGDGKYLQYFKFAQQLLKLKLLFLSQLQLLLPPFWLVAWSVAGTVEYFLLLAHNKAVGRRLPHLGPHLGPLNVHGRRGRIIPSLPLLRLPVFGLLCPNLFPYHLFGRGFIGVVLGQILLP